MLILVLLLILFAIGLFLRSSQGRQQLGIPSGRVIYTDTSGWGAVQEPLYDPALGLTGKPDYLVEDGDQIIPVEVKSSKAREAPYDEHIFQLAAYCYLVEKVYRKRPAYGIIHYPSRTFAVDYTAELESALEDLLAEMRLQDRYDDVARSHSQPARCLKCGYRSLCDQKI